MLISLNWLKKFVDIKISDEELIRLIGARLVEVEGVIDETHKYDKIYVAKVETCEKIPDTHLSLCQINVGDVLGGNFRDHSRPTGSEPSEASPVTTGRSERVPKDTAKTSLMQVVCGAPNVHAGMLAAWIAPGAVVPASVHEDAPFVIGTRKMLGKYESHGMLAGADELDFGDDHSGIVEIDPELAKPGDKLADIFELNDKILEIENKSLTHRPDCFGMVGFAREVAGILGQKFDNEFDFLPFSTPLVQARRPAAFRVPRGGRYGLHSLRSPREARGTRSQMVKIQIQGSDICPRYSALILEKHGELKKKYLTWQDTILAKSGMKPISPIVDATNYLMLLTGQPLHAFDYDKFVMAGKSDKPQIIVRKAKRGEKLVLLDDKEIELNENDIVITSNDVPVALAGAMGGKSTMIDDETKNIIIESATFSLYNLRKTQMAHGIFSEAITRFTKGQPAWQTLAVGEVCAEMLKDGFAVAAVADECSVPAKAEIIEITTDEINGLLGTDYAPELIIKTLENVGFGVSHSGSQLKIQAPVWRTDIHIKEDVIEEVGRLLGYDNIVPTLPNRPTSHQNPLFQLKKEIRDFLAGNGANEILTYSFVEGKNLLGDIAMQKSEKDFNSYKIVNSIAPALEYFRPQIAPSLLYVAAKNANSKDSFDDFVLFEMNQVAKKSDGLNAEKVPVMEHHLALVALQKNSDNSQYYYAKKYLEQLLNKLRINVRFEKFTPMNDGSDAMYEPERSANVIVDDKKIGVVGELRQLVTRKLGIPQYTAAFEVDLENLLRAKNQRKITFEMNKYPKAKRDLTVSTKQNYQKVYEQIIEVLENNELNYTIAPVSIYQPENSAETKNISFHLEFANSAKTMTADEISAIMAKLEKIA